MSLPSDKTMEVLRMLLSLLLPISPHPSVHEFLDQLEAEWKASILPPLGASPPSFITPPQVPVTTLEMR